MCLAISGKIISFAEKSQAIVDFDGVKRKVNLSLLEKTKVGDWVLVHVGFAIAKVNAKVAKESYQIIADINKRKS